MNMLARLVMSVGAGFATAIVVAVTAAVIDLYMTGHAYISITREVIAWPEAGIHLSIADVAMLVAAFAAAVSTWFFTDGRA